MSGNKRPIKAVPTNVITGFLGVGKTTSILFLLKNKPANERWAVLVNEFGEIGVDGSLMQGRHGEEQGVFIREVPGGCMCCAAGLPMQIALNQLLVIARPDRLLIEPTGLGHPKEVLQVLTGRAYREVLSVEQIITLVNARHLSDTRYTENQTFNQQIAVADIVVGNKDDLYQPNDREILHSYVRENSVRGVKVVFTVNGEIDPSLLTGLSGSIESLDQRNEPHHHQMDNTAIDTMPACGYLKKLNEGDGYRSVGWRFREDKIFRRDTLFSFLSGIDAERVKAVMNTENGVFGYNFVEGSLTELPLFGGGQSCIEIINVSVNDEWEAQLLQCLIITSTE
ncbi:MAG: G3E family GTPase [Porticoccaceae bacterium]|jgi:G3E family GTPase